MKLICAGLPKTGTKSIAHALRILGYNVYDVDEQMFYYMDEWLDLFKHGKVPDFYAMFKDVDAVTDIPCSVFFEELVEAFPDAKVILAEREENAWIKSYVTQNETMNSNLYTKIKCLLPTWKNFVFMILSTRIANIGTNDPKSSYIARKRYRWHNDRVKSVVPADKLLVYSVKQGWEPLCEFTGKKIPDQPFPHLNVKAKNMSSFQTETEFKRKIAGEVRVVMVCSVVVVALIGVMLMYLFRLYF